MVKVGLCILIVFVVGIFTNYIDSRRFSTNREPKFCIKLISNDNSKVTYWGLGYKVIRYVDISPREPYENNIGIKMGSWFMRYELSEIKIIEIEHNNKTLKVTSSVDINRLENILTNLEYSDDLCRGLITHTIRLNDALYYLKEGCNSLQKGSKQTVLSDENFKTIMKIINNYK